jgi:excinuclease ABC subunit B
MERAMAETQRRRDKQAAWNAEHGITPESVKSRIADILDSVYEKDHVRADIKGFAENEGALIGNNLTAHLEALEKQMRDAAADLDFERAARLRDEIKRLREAELEISDDPLAREVERLSPVSGREKGKHNKGRARHRTVDEKSLFAKPSLDEMGRAGDYATPAKKGFAKPSLDDMGPGTDMATPAGAISRSLFKKQSAREAHGSDFGIPESERGRSLFRKNTLDEMTVRRTEKPVEGEKPIKRETIGRGSYEDEADERGSRRRSKKTGRPGN